MTASPKDITKPPQPQRRRRLENGRAVAYVAGDRARKYSLSTTPLDRLADSGAIQPHHHDAGRQLEEMIHAAGLSAGIASASPDKVVVDTSIRTDYTPHHLDRSSEAWRLLDSLGPLASSLLFYVVGMQETVRAAALRLTIHPSDARGALIAALDVLATRLTPRRR